jgi:DDE superfamily endonuclease
VAASRGFPPLQEATVVALACALPRERDHPLSRYSTGDLARLISCDVTAPSLSRSTVWRILDRHVLKPWRCRSWLFPRDPGFAEKAGRVLDLYAGIWAGVALGADDYVLSADEKTSIQARGRRHPSTPPGPGAPMRVEHEYRRGGALAYLAAWDVRAGGVIGRCEATTGKAAFGRLVDQVMAQEPYRTAKRVFWIVDNGSSHRGAKAAAAVAARHPTVQIVHLPIHASWLNQIEIYFSILQRKVLTPNDFADLAAVEDRLTAFADQYNDTAMPFTWRFRRADLEARLAAVPCRMPTGIAASGTT